MKVALYMRVATLQQLGIDGQKEYLRNYIKAHPEWELTEEYCDAGVSGDRTSRPALLIMLQDVAAKKFDVLVMTAPDRIYRNTEKTATILKELSNLGIQVEFTNGFRSYPEYLERFLNRGDN